MTSITVIRSKRLFRRSKFLTQRSKLSLLTLPLELLWLIAEEILRDPETTPGEIKKLRLVCKSLDWAFAPIVLTKIRVFHDKNWQSNGERPHAELHQLRTLLGRADSNNRLSHVKKLVLHSWDWLFQPYTESATSSTLASECKQFAHSTMWPVVASLGYHLLNHHIGPRDWLPRLYRGTTISAQLSNVTCVKWSLRLPRHGPTESHRSFQLNLKLLEALPSLSELDLVFDPFYDTVEQFAITMSRLRNLRQLRVHMQLTHVDLRTVTLGWLKRAIAHNPNLTHFNLYQPKVEEPKQLVTLPDLFAGVPLHRPLMLQHLRICPQYCQISPSLIPNLRCLSSISVQHYTLDPSEMDEVWKTLRHEHIHVREVKSNSVSQEMINYLSCLPNLTSLYIYSPGYWQQWQRIGTEKNFFSVLSQKADTLRCLRLEPYDWAYWCHDPDNLASLRQCNNLEQLVLHKVECRRGTSRPSIPQLVNFVSQLGAQLELVVDGDPILYTGLLEHCRKDTRLSVQNLLGRIVYKR